jgi:hypothetical protein
MEYMAKRFRAPSSADDKSIVSYILCGLGKMFETRPPEEACSKILPDSLQPCRPGETDQLRNVRRERAIAGLTEIAAPTFTAPYNWKARNLSAAMIEKAEWAFVEASEDLDMSSTETLDASGTRQMQTLATQILEQCQAHPLGINVLNATVYLASNTIPHGPQ